MKYSVIVFDSQETLQPPTIRDLRDYGLDLGKEVNQAALVWNENDFRRESNVFLPIDTSGETVFYTMSVYFLAAKVTKTRYTLTGALLATLAGTVASVVLTRMMV